MKKTATLISLMLIGILIPSSVLWAADSLEERLVRGKRIYTFQCAGCHGDDGEDTSRGEGTKTLPGIHIRRTDYEIGHRFRGLMATLFTEQERADLVAYVKSLKGAKGYEHPEYLINPVGLRPFVTDPGVRIIDLRPEKDYLDAHMPNAVYLDPARLQPMPDPDNFAAIMTSIGIGDDTYVVAYDDDGGRYAALLWASLQDYGHERVSVLDGGWLAWVHEIGTMTHWKPSKRQVMFTPRPRTYTFVQKDLSIGDKTQTIYVGQLPTTPSKIRIAWSRNLDIDSTFLSASELKHLYGTLGVHPNLPAVTISDDPAEAAQTLFVLRLLGYPRVRARPAVRKHALQPDLSYHADTLK